MKTVLIIDDDPAILLTSALALSQRSYRVLTARTGEEGLSLTRHHLPDVVLCDLHLGTTDGCMVIKTLREDTRVAGIQVVLITGDLTFTSRRAMEFGADDFLRKPVTAASLLSCVEARLKRASVHRLIEDKMLRDLRSNLHSTLPHEFFTPLAGILGLAGILRSEFLQLRPADVQEMLGDIEQCGQRLHRTLKNYLLVLDLESSAPAVSQPAQVYSSDHVRQYVAQSIGDTVKRRDRESDLSITVQDAAQYRLTSDVATILEELVENACQYSRKGSPIQVELRPSLLTVRDEGRGMTAEEMRQVGIFRQFDPKQFDQQGLGLGLVVVQKLAARMGAQLRLESEPGRGTTAMIDFDLAPRGSNRSAWDHSST